jgi:8-hydroxy-5-deazaflavin:NADPH oxidoreductase
MKPRVAIIGRGNVGSAIQRGLERVGYEVRAVGDDPAGVRETSAWGEAIVLAVPFGAVDDTVREMGDAVNSKPLIDATNALSPDYELALGCTTSGAEELQKKAPSARVVKAFNTIFAKNMDSGQVAGTPITLFVAGDDAEAKDQALSMGRDIGFDAVDAGPLKNARWLETLGYFQIQLGYALKMGQDMGLKLVR